VRLPHPAGRGVAIFAHWTTPDVWNESCIHISLSDKSSHHGFIFSTSSSFFPAASVFYLLFSGNGAQNIPMDFIIDQLVDPIFFCKTFHKAAFMLPDSTDKVVGNPGIKNAIPFVCHDIDIILMFMWHNQ